MVLISLASLFIQSQNISIENYKPRYEPICSQILSGAQLPTQSYIGFKFQHAAALSRHESQLSSNQRGERYDLIASFIGVALLP